MNVLEETYNLIHQNAFTFQGPNLDVEGWSSIREDQGQGPRMLSRYDGERTDKTFDIPENTGSVAIDFRLFEIGAWDGQSFIAHINGQDVNIGSFMLGVREGATSFDAGNGITVEKSQEIGRSDGHSTFHNVRITIEDPGTQLDLGFSSTLEGEIGDGNWRYAGDIWGVDTLKIAVQPKPVVETPNTGKAVAFELYDDGSSPIESAVYNAETGLLDLTFSWEKLLQDSGTWGDARHIDFVEFDGVMYGINIHSDDGPKTPDGMYIYDQTTMNNTFTLDIGKGFNPADGILSFALHDYADGSKVLYDFQMSNLLGSEQVGLVRAVNAGGDTFTAIDGLVYEADANMDNTYSENHSIAGTTSDAVYQSEKGAWNGFTYETGVANGFYDVELKFAEIWSGAQQAGARDFSVYVEDQLVFEGLDLTDEYGFATAVDFIGTVEVSDGSLTIEGVNGSNNAKISGFSIWDAATDQATDFSVGSIGDYRAAATMSDGADGPDIISPNPLGDFPDGTPAPDPQQPEKTPDADPADGDVSFTDQDASFALYQDGTSPIESATYDGDTGLLDLTFDWSKLLQAEGQWGNARHIDFVQVNGVMHEIGIHEEGTLQNADGSYVYNKTTMENMFTLDIGAGLDPASGILNFELHDYEDGSKKLYDFQMSNALEAEHEGLISAVNAGGDTFTSIQGVTYGADTTGGSTYGENHNIANTTSDVLYQTEKGQWNGFTYETEVVNGFYEVELKFAEIWSGAKEAGARTFSIKVEDEFVFEDMDLTDEAGFASALDYVGTVEVTDGSLTIQGLNGSNNAKISGFSIWESGAEVETAFQAGSLFDTTSNELLFG